MHLTRRALLATAAATAGTACAARQRPPTSGAAPAGSPCWTAAGRLPHAVQEIYPAAHRGRIHVSGGLLSAGGRIVGVSPHHMAFDPASGQTALLAPSPAPRHHPQLVSCKGRLYQLGGFSSSWGAVSWTMSRETLVHDDAADGWSQRSPAPAPHGECVAASLGDRIHLAGGRAPKGEANAAYGDHADSSQHLVYDPGADAWSSAAPAPTARNSAAGGVIGGLWHVAGGRTVTGGPTDAHEVYDPKEDRWRTAAPMPAGAGAGGNAAGVIGGDLYVFGGEYLDPRPGGVKSAAWRYSPARDAWEQVSDMPTPRHGLGGVTMGDAIHLLAGATRPSGNGTSDIVETFRIGCG